MKSMLHEASSIIKAIEKAWIESGKPSEFTIKVLEEGQRGFLGLSKRPAIVSITFTSVKPVDKSRFKERDFQPRKAKYEPQAPQARQPERPKVQRADSQDFVKRQQAAKKPEHESHGPQGHGPQARVPQGHRPQGHGPQGHTLPTHAPSAHSAPTIQAQVEEVWTTECVNFVADNLKDLLKTLQFQIGFNTRADKRNLFISFEKPIMDEPEDNRFFLNATAYLLMQFLKRKYKKKFRGYQILMNSAVSNESTSPGK